MWKDVSMIRKAVLIVILVLIENSISDPLETQGTHHGLYSKCLHVIKHGAGKPGSPILLIHGLGSSKADWRGPFQVLASYTGRKVCTIDLRNHGASFWSNVTDLKSMVSDVQEFLLSKKIVKVNMVGHGVGGKIALHYALKYPQVVDSLVVEDMRPNDVPQEALVVVRKVILMFRQSIESVPKGSTVEETRQFVTDVVNKKLKEIGTEERIQGHVAKHLPIRCSEEKCEWQTNIDLLEKITMNPEPYMVESSGLYKGPTLFIYGTKSPFNVQDDKETILKLFPNAELIPVEGAGHAVHGVFKEFDNIVINFLKRV